MDRSAELPCGPCPEGCDSEERGQRNGEKDHFQIFGEKICVQGLLLWGIGWYQY